MSIERLQLAARALTGIAIGDAFGESFFGNMEQMHEAVQKRRMPNTNWNFTDDTVMAIALYKSLEKFGTIEQDYVAGQFSENYKKDSNRGYGPSIHRGFREMAEGKYWKEIAESKFDGQGSMGNGGAMRSAVLGSYFYDDLEKVKDEATRSCVITHSNVEAVCGAMAVAIATAITTREKLNTGSYDRESFFKTILAVLPDCDTKSKVNKACSMDGNYRIETMIHALGNGERMLAQDTVPLALWCVAKNMHNYEACMWETVSAFGDRDTLCAIAGGIVIMGAEEKTVPLLWTESVEQWEESIFYKEQKKTTMNEKHKTHISKFLSLVLRHKPETIGIALDENGWADVNELIEKCAKKGNGFTKEELDEVVATNEKKRFAYNEDETKIRACQGHSVDVDLALQHATPPATLYHGTVEQFLGLIMSEGLKKMRRQHVHLSADMETATKVGSRRGKPIILTINTGAMYKDGYEFYLSANGVWLTDSVPVKYIEFTQ